MEVGSMFGTKKLYLLFILLYFITGCNDRAPLPRELIGNFEDDYGIKYSISDSLWVQHPGSIYILLEHYPDQQVIIAQNHPDNASDANLFTRIDYTYFDGMEPFKWGFCLTAYDSESAKEAFSVAAADRENPRKGCNGFPFSRMKK